MGICCNNEKENEITNKRILLEKLKNYHEIFTKELQTSKSNLNSPSSLVGI